MKSRLLPVAQFAVGRSQFFRSLCCDQTNNYVRPMAMVKFSREHHSGSDLRRVCATKGANHNVAGPQRPSRSCCSNRSRDASEASRRSSSDQESDHSTPRPPPRSASCCAQTSTFLASSGGSIRTTLMSDSSLTLRTMASIPRSQFNAIDPPGYCQAPHDLRRTCARLCRDAGGELDRIQFLLGHVSVQTTERYLGCKQRLQNAVNDRIGIEPTIERA